MGFILNIDKFIESISKNRLDIIFSLLSLLGVFVTAIFGLKLAFQQLSAQFRHKLQYEAWRSFKDLYYDTAVKISSYNAKIGFLNSYLNTLDK